MSAVCALALLLAAGGATAHPDERAPGSAAPRAAGCDVDPDGRTCLRGDDLGGALNPNGGRQAQGPTVDPNGGQQAEGPIIDPNGGQALGGYIDPDGVRVAVGSAIDPNGGHEARAARGAGSSTDPLGG